jgi:hypothetical protein
LDVEFTRVILGVCILLAVALLPVRKDSSSRYAFLSIMLGAATAIGLAALVLNLGDFVLDNPDEGIVKGQMEIMQRDQIAHVPKNLIVIEGSSQTLLGIDNAAVEEELRSSGYDATVVQLAADGGTHMERYTMLSRFAAEVMRHGLSLSPNTRLMLEVAPGYDMHPVRFFMENKDTLRGYYFADFANIAFAMHSMRIVNQQFDANNMASLAALSHDALVSTFKIGLLLQMRPFQDVDPLSSFQPMNAPKARYTFRKYDAQKYVRTPADDLDEASIDLTEYRTGRIADLFGSGITETDYFSVPTANNERMMRYAHSFCRWRASAPCIDATDPAIYEVLDSADDYYNRDHLSQSGAEIYSRYFAQQLISQAVVIK